MKVVTLRALTVFAYVFGNILCMSAYNLGRNLLSRLCSCLVTFVACNYIIIYLNFLDPNRSAYSQDWFMCMVIQFGF